MSKYSIHQFVQNTKQDEHAHDFFELETERLLEVNLDGLVWAKAGSMISYEGNIKFEREGILEHGLGKFVKKAFSGEGAQLMKANGLGKLYVADNGKKITVLDLEGESIYINGNDLLAFQDGLTWDIKLMRRVAGMMAGGLFNIRLEGRGLVAFTSHYEPLTLLVTPDKPIFTDPNATVAWSGSLEPDFVTDIQLKSLFGRGSGESVQMKFSGNGFVVVQPFEEVYQVQQ
ncbi:hypothetical protein Plano_1584 [Planococcus sp. PAMC 21323]|uniref:AIM24 family protein n=1 Tax=Planococcus sp. PAMC 21323 TaxID=1526927 RepID=UPI0005715FFD|nr:AIM24 family protein [Planococcus sp. PAMC 21323]AIY05549.1 hypothetical protein Plano_1584 [Planococcus sp. PAMC 21323]